MRNKSTKRILGSMLLAFESFVVFFEMLVAFGLKVADGPTVWAIGLSLSFLLILTPAILGKKFSYAWGWFLQLVVVSLGIWVPLMYLFPGADVPVFQVSLPARLPALVPGAFYAVFLLFS